MTVAEREEDFFGEALTPVERVLAGIPALFGLVGHVLLGITAVVLVYVLLTAGV